MKEKRVYMEKLFFIILQVVITFWTYNANSVSLLAWLGVIQIIFSVITIMKQKKEIMSISIFFLVFSFLLHMGQYILPLLNSGILPSFDMTWYVTEGEMISTGKFLNYAHIAVVSGMLMYSQKKSKVKLVWERDKYTCIGAQEINPKILRLIAAVLIFIGLFVSIGSTIDLIKLMLSGGYYETFSYYDAYGGGLRKQLATFWEIGVMILFYINRKEKGKCRAILVISLIYLAVTMLTGGRIVALMNMVVLFITYYKIVEKLQCKKLILIFILGFFFVQYVVNIGLSRTAGFGTSFDVGLSIRDLVARVLAEFGGTGYTVILTMKHVPQNVPYLYGMTYPLSLMYVFPNFGWNSWNIFHATSFTDYLREYTSSGIGGSYIAEVYFNWGYYGIVFLYAIGVFLSWFDAKINELIYRERWIQILPYLAVMPYILMITRSYFKDIIRPFAWMAVISFVLYRMFRRKVMEK